MTVQLLREIIIISLVVKVQCSRIVNKDLLISDRLLLLQPSH